jgi:hypothetical protein
MTLSILIFFTVGIIFGGSVLLVFYHFFKMYSYRKQAPSILEFTNLSLLFSRYLTEEGIKHRNLYFKWIGLSFILALLTVLSGYILIPELREEIIHFIP